MDVPLGDFVSWREKIRSFFIAILVLGAKSLHSLELIIRKSLQRCIIPPVGETVDDIIVLFNRLD